MKRRVVGVLAGISALAMTLALVLGRDDWGRTIQEPTADAAYYYAYLPSLVVDRDLDLANQYQVTGDFYRLGTTPKGRRANVFGIGPAVFELPVFVIAHGLALATGARGDGFSRIEETAVLWLGIPCALASILLAYRLARRRAGGYPALAGIAMAFVAGPSLYYVIRQPGYAHPFAMLFATWLVERWDASYDRPRTLRTWIGLGALAGAAILARPQLALWGALLLPAAAFDDIRRRVPIAQLAVRWGLAAIALVIAIAPQLIAWKLLYGRWYLVPQGDGFMRWDAPAWSETLFSSRNGLFPWAPLYLPMLLGVLALARKEIRLPLALLLGLFAQAVANGAAWDWWAGGSFGGRRFDSCFVVFAVGGAIGCAAAAKALARGGWRRIVAGGVLVVAILIAVATVELAMRTSVTSARIFGGEPASEVWVRRIGGVRGQLAAWLSSAATLPVRAGFAWRHGVPLDAYDRMIGVHKLGETFPGLNAHGDLLVDQVGVHVGSPQTSGLAATTENRARMTEPTARIRFALNRRAPIRISLTLSGTGQARVSWGELTLDVALDRASQVTLLGSPARGLNTVTIEAPVGTLVSPLDLTATLP